jgi:hypothetical protein
MSGASAHEALRCTDAPPYPLRLARCRITTRGVVRDVFACYESASLIDPMTALIRLGLLPNPGHQRSPRATSYLTYKQCGYICQCRIVLLAGSSIPSWLSSRWSV